MNEAIALVVGYLLGSIPFGYLAGRLRGIDIRTAGSGNIGAANAFRTLGRKWGIAVMIGDIAKGLVAVLVARAITDDPWPILAGAAVMVGAIFPVWLRFKGGKGVAAAGGVTIGLFPIVSALLVPLWLILVVATRITSVGSITAAALFAPVAALFGYDWPYLVLAGAIGLLVIVRHRGNIKRLLSGTENKIELRKRRQPATAPPGGPDV